MSTVYISPMCTDGELVEATSKVNFPDWLLVADQVVCQVTFADTVNREVGSSWALRVR